MEMEIGDRVSYRYKDTSINPTPCCFLICHGVAL